jgi:hypothetical protein
MTRIWLLVYSKNSRRTCTGELQVVLGEGHGVAVYRVMQQLILVLLCQLAAQPQPPHLAVVQLQRQHHMHAADAAGG